MQETKPPDAPSTGTSRRRGAPLPIIVTLVALLAASFAFTAGISDRVFERIPHNEDELAFVFQAKTIAEGHLFVAAPPQPDSFSAPFLLIRDGRWFGKYPPGYPALLALGVLVGAPWLLNPLAGTLGLLVIFLIAREIFDDRVGLIAVALGLASPFYLILTGSLMSHATSMLCFALFVLFFIRTGKKDRIFYPLAAGSTLGLAFLNRQLTAVGLAAPFAVYALVTLLPRGRRRRLADYALMTAAFLPFVAVYLWYNDFFTGSPFRSTYELYWEFDKIGFGKGIGTLGEHTVQMALVNTRIDLDAVSKQLFGWPGRWSMALLFIPFLCLRGGKWDLLFYASFVSLAAAYMLYWTTGNMYGPRYYYESLPLLLLLSARGLVVMAERLSQLLRATGRAAGALRQRGATRGPGPASVAGRAGPPNEPPATAGSPVSRRALTAEYWAPLAGWSLSALAVVALVAFSTVGYLRQEFAHWYGWYGITAKPLEAVQRGGVHHALVFVAIQKGWEDYGAVFPANSPTLDSDVVYAIDRGAAANAELAQHAFPGRQTYLLRGTRLEGF